MVETAVRGHIDRTKRALYHRQLKGNELNPPPPPVHVITVVFTQKMSKNNRKDNRTILHEQRTYTSAYTNLSEQAMTVDKDKHVVQSTKQ